MRSNEIQLTRFNTLQEAEPGLGGILQLAADGAATLRKDQAPLFSTLNANVAARGLSMNQKPLGDLTATAETKGQDVDFDLTSDLAHANIRGTGRMQLAGDYPLNAQLNFSNVTYSGPGAAAGLEPGQPFDAFRGRASHRLGPAQPDGATSGATLQIAKLEAHSVGGPDRARSRASLSNCTTTRPLSATLDRSLVTVHSAHIVGTVHRPVAHRHGIRRKASRR